MPLFMVSLRGLGTLAVKFPNIAGTSITYLRDFLVDPSPILTKLYQQIVHNKRKEQTNASDKVIHKSYSGK